MLRRAAAVAMTTAFALGAVPIAHALDAGGTTTVDRPAAGLPFDGVASASLSTRRAISDDGRYVAFSSQSDALALGALPSQFAGVYRKDLQTGDVVLVSRRDDESPMQGIPGDPSISADGTKVAFSTTDPASSADTNATSDIYVRDITAGTTTLVSCVMGAACAAAPAGAQGSYQPSISGDGSTVAWQTQDDLTDASLDDTDTRQDIYARRGSTTYLISVNEDGSHDNSSAGYANEADVNGDGTKVAFEHDRALLVFGGTTDTNSSTDVFVRTGLGSGTLHTYIASHSFTNEALGGSDPSIADDTDTTVAFETSTNLGTDNDGDRDIYTQHITGAFEAQKLISAVNGTTDGDGDATASEPSISADATKVAFTSNDKNLVTEDSSGDSDIYLRSGTATTLVHRATGAAGAPGDGFASRASLARSASTVAMLTPASLDPADGGLPDVYVRAQGDTTTTWAGRPTSGPTAIQAGNGRLSTRGRRVSDDGRFTVFASSAPALSANGTTGVFRRDLTTGEVIRLDVTPGGGAPDRSASQATISSDGAKVAFISSATDLVSGDTNNRSDAFVRDVAAGATTIAATSADATGEPSLSGNGRFLAFTAKDGIDAAADTNGYYDVYLRDLTGGTPILVSRADGAAGAASSNGAGTPSVSDDGSRVLFLSDSTNLPDGDALYDAYVRDVAGGRTLVISRTATGAAPDQAVSDAVLSGDGTRAAWQTAATNIGDGDSDSNYDVHVVTVADGTKIWATRGIGGAALDRSVQTFELSRDGRLLQFISGATNADPADVSADDDVFVRDLATGTTVLAAKTAAGASPDGNVIEAGMSADGGCVAFSTAAPGVDPAGYPSADYTHIYLHARTRACPGTPLTPGGGGPGTGPGGGTTPKDTTAPRITNLKVTSTRKRKVTIRFKVSEAARITLKVQREVRGTKKGKKCVKRRKTGKRCTRLVTVGTVTRTVKKAGTVTVVLKGKVGKKKLTVARHRLTVQARDTAGNRSKAVTRRFTVKR